MARDGVPLPSALSGEIVERIIRLDSALLYLVTGVLSWLVDKEKLEETGTLTEGAARDALSDMLWDYLTGEPMPQFIVGEYKLFAFKPAPTGWLQCLGQVVLQADYAELYAVIGGNFNTGGEAGNEFRLPDFGGRAIAGMAAGETNPTNVYGQADYALELENITPHRHQQAGSANSRLMVENTNIAGSNWRQATEVQSNGTSPTLTASAGGLLGSAVPFELFQPTGSVNMCIYSGVV